MERVTGDGVGEVGRTTWRGTEEKIAEVENSADYSVGQVRKADEAGKKRVGRVGPWGT